MRQPLRRFKADFFKALAHPGRIKILESLREGEKTVTEIQALLDDEPASASQHLALPPIRPNFDQMGRNSTGSTWIFDWSLSGRA